MCNITMLTKDFLPFWKRCVTAKPPLFCNNLHNGWKMSTSKHQNGHNIQSTIFTQPVKCQLIACGHSHSSCLECLEFSFTTFPNLGSKAIKSPVLKPPGVFCGSEDVTRLSQDPNTQGPHVYHACSVH